MRNPLGAAVLQAILLALAGPTLVSAAEWGKVSVAFPVSDRQFPAGEGASIADSQCLICHSAGMVLTQPARTQAQWKETINKMRSAYGAPIPMERIDALALYLSQLPAEGDLSTDVSRSSDSPMTESAPASATRAAVSDGALIFTGHCAACHQTAGAGLPGVFPPLAGSDWVNGRDTAVVQVLLHGLQGTVTVNGVAYQGAMPSFGNQLSTAQIAAVLTYIRSQWGNKAGAVSEALVATQRAASAGRIEPWNGDTDLAAMK